MKTAGIIYLWAAAILVFIFLVYGWWTYNSPTVLRIKAVFRWIGKTFFRHPAPRFVDDPHVRVDIRK